MGYYNLDPCDISEYPYPLPSFRVEPIKFVSVFNEETCAKMVQRLSTLKASFSGVYGEDGKEKVATQHRSSRAITVTEDIETQVRARLQHVIEWHTRKDDLGGKLVLCEELTFLRYDGEDGGHFSLHTDSAYHDGDRTFHLTSPERKITMVVALNSGFEGGKFVMPTVRDPDGRPMQMEIPPGSAMIFPSDLRFPHAVTPVTSGTRYSIVAWYDIRKAAS